MRVFKTKWFARFARQEGLTDDRLIAAIHEVSNGLTDGNLGGGLVKKRIGRAGAGKRGGYRTISRFETKQEGILRLWIRQKRDR